MPTALTQRGALDELVMMATVEVAWNAQVVEYMHGTSSNTHFCKIASTQLHPNTQNKGNSMYIAQSRGGIGSQSECILVSAMVYLPQE